MYCFLAVWCNTNGEHVLTAKAVASGLLDRRLVERQHESGKGENVSWGVGGAESGISRCLCTSWLQLLLL